MIVGNGVNEGIAVLEGIGVNEGANVAGWKGVGELVASNVMDGAMDAVEAAAAIAKSSACASLKKGDALQLMIKIEASRERIVDEFFMRFVIIKAYPSAYSSFLFSLTRYISRFSALST